MTLTQTPDVETKNHAKPLERILIVDSDRELTRDVAHYLENVGYVVQAVHDGAVGLHQFRCVHYSLIILEVRLAGLDGLSLLRSIRSESRVPVLILSNPRADADRVVGLETGADDYMAKPANPRELLARIRAILRRSGSERRYEPPSTPVIVGDISLDRSARTVRKDGQRIGLTCLEFDLLEQLLRSAGKVLSREHLAKSLLGRELTPFDRTIEMHVCNLRKKLGNGADGCHRIKGIRGVGYVYPAPGTVGCLSAL